MTEAEFVELQREVNRRNSAIRQNRVDLRIARADVSRLESAIAIDIQIVEDSERRLGEHWHELFHGVQQVTA